MYESFHNAEFNMGGTGMSTHIANAYPETIYAKVSNEQFYAKYVKESSSTDVNAGAKAGPNEAKAGVKHSSSQEREGVWRKIAPGFQRIASGTWVKFQNFDATEFEKKEVSSASGVFLTIRTEGGQYLATDLPRSKDTSIIIDRSGNVVDQKYGASPFVDIHGHNHH